MATGTTRRTAANTIGKEGLLWPKIVDPDTLSADLHAIARALENDVEGGQGKLSERPAPALRGRLFYVTEGVETGLYWDTGSQWVELQGIQISEKLSRVLPYFRSHSGAVLAQNGEMIKMTGSGTVTLTGPFENNIIGIFCVTGETKVKAIAGAKIYGDFINEVEEIKLTSNQHVLLIADGSNWFIVAGEPKDEQTYGAKTLRKASTKFLCSASRTTLVILSLPGVGATFALKTFVGGVELPEVKAKELATASISFICPAGVEWEYKTGEATEATSTYLTQ